MSAREASGRQNRSVALRVFVVGVPRSGTTLVQSLLTAHSRVTSFTESHFFSRFFKILTVKRALLVSDPSDRFEEFLLENGLNADEATEWAAPLRKVASSRGMRPLRSRSVGELLVDGLDRLALRRGLDVWVEKTPRHLRYTPWLDGLLAQRGPERPQFVHVVRRGPEAAASLFLASQNWEQAYDLATCARRWNEDVEFSASLLGLPDHHVVFYEELTSSPELALRLLISALGLDWEAAMLAGYSAAAQDLVAPGESWKVGTDRPLETSNASWLNLSSAQRDEVEQSIRPGVYEALYTRHRGQPPQAS